MIGSLGFEWVRFEKSVQMPKMFEGLDRRSGSEQPRLFSDRMRIEWARSQTTGPHALPVTAVPS